MAVKHIYMVTDVTAVEHGIFGTELIASDKRLTGPELRLLEMHLGNARDNIKKKGGYYPPREAMQDAVDALASAGLELEFANVRTSGSVIF